MCPLRLILIFLSATLAGFFVLRGLRGSHPQIRDSDAVSPLHDQPPSASRGSPKVLSAVGSGFRTLVDMASGRYLWTHLVSSSQRTQ